MGDVQSWIASGLLLEDCQLKFTPSGYPICNFKLHSERSYQVKDEMRNEVLDADCTILGKDGERLAPQLRAGVKLMVRGRWKLSIWTDQKSGQERRRHVVTVDDCDVLGTTVLQVPQMPPMGSGSIAAEEGMPF